MHGGVRIMSLSSFLLVDLKELLDTMATSLKSGDRRVLAELRQATQGHNTQYISVYNAYLGAIIDYFCQAAKNKPLTCSLAPGFVAAVIELTKLKSVDLAHFGYPLIDCLMVSFATSLICFQSTNVTFC